MIEFATKFLSTLETTEENLKPIPPGKSTTKPAPDKWSAREILGHLIDSAIVNTQRFLNAQTQEHLVFSGYPQNQYVKSQKYQEQDWQQLIQTWKQINLHIKEIVERIPQSVLDKPHHKHNFHEIAFRSVTAEEPLTLRFLIEDYHLHMVHHLNQIFRLHGLDFLTFPPFVKGDYPPQRIRLWRKGDFDSFILNLKIISLFMSSYFKSPCPSKRSQTL